MVWIALWLRIHIPVTALKLNHACALTTTCCREDGGMRAGFLFNYG